MMSFSMYTIESVDDARLVADIGVLDLIINGSECENCGMAIGPSLDEFFPCVIVCHDAEEESWPICIDCAGAAIFPDEAPLLFEFDPDIQL
jgi:hypothetical protein